MRSLALVLGALAAASCAHGPTGELANTTCPAGWELAVSESGKHYWCEGGPMPEGVAMSWYERGRLEWVHRFANGKLVGAVSFYKTGAIEHVELSHDGDRSIVLYWYENGARKTYAEWRGDKLNGMYRAFHPNGELRAEARFLDGELVGEWSYCTQDQAPRNCEANCAPASTP